MGSSEPVKGALLGGVRRVSQPPQSDASFSTDGFASRSRILKISSPILDLISASSALQRQSQPSHSHLN